jgi:hypothetical protein
VPRFAQQVGRHPPWIAGAVVAAIWGTLRTVGGYFAMVLAG